jgi:dihydrofolate reductase
MGKIVSNFFIALDGVVEAPDEWHIPYFNDEMGAVVGAGMETNKAFLMGRTLYDEWAAYWPDSTDEPFATYFNEVPKYVISGSLDKAAWNNTTVLPGEVDAVRRFKESIDGDIGMAGSPTTARWLLSNGLLDELRLLVHPIAVGHGQRLFEGSTTHKLRLVESATLSTGVLNVIYAPVPA